MSTPRAPVALGATIERKQADLPRFAVVPARALAAWELEGTTVVEVDADGVALGRRTVKRWDERRWFVTVTEKDCRLLAKDTGDRIALVLRRAEEALPAELERLLRDDPRAADRWSRLTPSRQRAIREHVRGARRTDTRARRARRALLDLDRG